MTVGSVLDAGGKLAERLAYDRRRQHVTQLDLASRLHMTRRAVIYWEQGAVIPRAATLRAIAAELGADSSLYEALRAVAVRERREMH